MAESRIDPTERLSRLERQVRRSRLAIAGLGLLTVALFGMVATLVVRISHLDLSGIRPEVVAQRFILVDSKGEKVGELRSWPRGNVVGLILLPRPQTVAIANTSGTKGASPISETLTKKFLKRLLSTTPEFADIHGSALLATSGGSSLLLTAAGHGNDSVSFGAKLEDGLDSGATLSLQSRPSVHGIYAVRLAATDGAFADLTSPEGRNVQLVADDPGEFARKFPVVLSGLDIDEPKLSKQITLANVSNGTSNISLRENFKSQAELESNSDNSPHLDLYDSAGNLRAVLGTADLQVSRTGAMEKTAPSSLTLFDKKGKVLWQIPP
jgi:hypothetical protein